MTENEKQEFEWHVNGLAGYIYGGVIGTDPLQNKNLLWRDILREAVEKVIAEYNDLEDYRD